MPERVQLPKGLPRRYSSLFKQVCEQQNPESIANSAVVCLRKDVRDSGKGGDRLIARACKYLRPIAQDSLLRRTVNWDDEHDKIVSMAKIEGGDAVDVQATEVACRQLLLRLEEGEEVQNIEFELKKQRLLNLWEARFKENIRLTESFHAGANYEMVMEHLMHVRPYLKRAIENELHGVKPPKIEDIFEGDVMQGIFR